MFNRDEFEIKLGFPVYLKVYHISFFNYAFQIFGYGLYHTTLEIHDKEYFFYYTEHGFTGIMFLSVEETMNKIFTLKGNISKLNKRKNIHG